MACPRLCFTSAYRQCWKSSLFYSRWLSLDLIIVFVVINYMAYDFRKFLLFIIYGRCVNMYRVKILRLFENRRLRNYLILGHTLFTFVCHNFNWSGQWTLACWLVGQFAIWMIQDWWLIFNLIFSYPFPRIPRYTYEIIISLGTCLLLSKTSCLQTMFQLSVSFKNVCTWGKIIIL